MYHNLIRGGPRDLHADKPSVLLVAEIPHPLALFNPRVPHHSVSPFGALLNRDLTTGTFLDPKHIRGVEVDAVNLHPEKGAYGVRQQARVRASEWSQLVGQGTGGSTPRRQR